MCWYFGVQLRDVERTCWIHLNGGFQSKHMKIRFPFHANKSHFADCIRSAMIGALHILILLKKMQIVFVVNTRMSDYNAVRGYLRSMIVVDVLHQIHDDVIKWNHFPRYWPFVRGIHRSPVNSPHKGQWRGALMFSLIYAWITVV